MEDAQHFDHVGDAIDEDVVGVDDRLARAGQAAGAVEKRMRGQAFRGVPDRGIEASRCGGITLGDIVENAEQVRGGLVCPDEGQGHFALCFSMIAWAIAMTSSCGMRGAVDAIAFSTLARNHAS